MTCLIFQVTLDSNSAGSAGELDFSTFLSIMHQQLQQEAPEQEILQALLMADKEQSGYILVSELRAKLTALGEKLTDQEGGRCRRRPSCLFPLCCASLLAIAETLSMFDTNMLQPFTHPPGGSGDVLYIDLSTP